MSLVGELRHHRNARGRFASSPAEDRFWARVEKSDRCWLWRGAISGSGYGGFAPSADREGTAHRYAYELLVGPIPPGLTIDHLCRVRACVNPAHLEAVTYAENNLRSWAARDRPTACPNGHDLTPENIYRWRNHRECLTCRRTNGRKSARLARERRMVVG